MTGASKEIHLNPDKDGKFLLGSHFHILQDESKKTFETDNMEAFESFLADKEGGNEIYFNADHLYLVPAKPSMNSHALAHCAMKPSAALALLSSKAGKDMGILDFEKFLTALRKNCSEANRVLSYLRNFSVAKKQTYERVSDNQGNFKLLIQKEGAEGGNWTPPETMSFEVPVFSYLDDTMEIIFDFRYFIADEGSKPMFTLENLNIIEEVQDRRREIIESRLGNAATCPTFWGESKLHVATDKWKYQENKATL